MMMTVPVVETIKSTFNFDVEKLPLAGPDNIRTPYYGLFRSDNMEVVSPSSVTKRYVPHTTDDILALVESSEDLFEEHGSAKCYFNNGHYVILEPSKEFRRSVYGTADNVFPRLVLRAGYDGKAFTAAVGYYRDLCSNMHIMRMVKGTHVTIRHTSGLRQKMKELRDTFEMLGNGWDNLTAAIDRMQQTEVSIGSVLDSIYGAPNENSQRAVTMHKNRTEAIVRRIAKERNLSGRPALAGDGIVSAWEILNGIQGYIQWDASRRESDLVGRAVQSMNDPTVRKAEELLMSMSA